MQKAVINAISMGLRVTRIGQTPVDLNDLVVGNELGNTVSCFQIFEWWGADKSNVTNKPYDDGATIIVWGFTDRECCQLVLPNNNGPTYYRRRGQGTWSAWVNIRDASWINSGTFDAARIPTSLPAVTAGYAQNLTPGGASGQYLKSNGSGNAPSWANPSDMTAGRAMTIYDGMSAGMDHEVKRYGTLNTSSSMSGWYKIATVTRTGTNYSSARICGTIFTSGSNWAASKNLALHFQAIFNYAENNVCIYHTPIEGIASIIRLVVTSTGVAELQVQPQAKGNWTNFQLYAWIDSGNATNTVFESALNTPGSAGTVLDNYYIDETYSGYGNGLGTSGQYLKSMGANAAPVWENVTTLSPTAAVTNFDSFNGTVNTTNVVNSNAGSSSTNPPKTDSRTFHVITTVGSSANYQTQLAIGIDADRHAGLFYRCKESGTWNSWMQVLNDRPVSMEKGSEYKGIHTDSNGHPVACLYGLSIGTAVADSSILTVL